MINNKCQVIWASENAQYILLVYQEKTETL
jgi:hypothetical protein